MKASWRKWYTKSDLKDEQKLYLILRAVGKQCSDITRYVFWNNLAAVWKGIKIREKEASEGAVAPI